MDAVNLSMSDVGDGLDNPFEKMGIAPSFHLDLKALDQTYLRLQHQIHPDQLRGNALAQQAATQLSAAITKAYHLLKNPLTRAEFFFRQAGQWPLKPVEQSTPELLEEMMDLQERLEDDQTSPDPQAFLDQMQGFCTAALKELSDCFQDKAFDVQEATYHYHRLSYLLKLQERVVERLG